MCYLLQTEHENGKKRKNDYGIYSLGKNCKLSILKVSYSKLGTI